MRPLVRYARAAAIALVTVAALYVVLANAFLSTGWFARVVNGYPETIDVHYARGWTLWPGTVHARDLSIRATDSNVEWIVRIDQVTFEVSLWGLLHRRFFADHVRGTGVSLRIRQRLDKMPATHAQVADLPPIEGLPPYALRPTVNDPYPDWDDAYWDLWTIRLRDVVAEHTREVWIDDERFSGDARVTGGFYLKPVREAQIGPVHAEIAEGSLTRGTRTAIAATLGGSIDATVDAFDPRVTFGRTIFERVSARASLSAELQEPFGAFVTARLATSSGRIEDGSRVLAFAPHVVLPVGDMEARGAVAATAASRGNELDVTLESRRARLERSRTSIVEGDVTLAARARGLDLAQRSDTIDVSGSRLVLEHASLVARTRVEGQWAAEATVDHAHVHLSPARFEGRVSLGASDALPLFATVLRDEAPRIIESLLALPRLQGVAWLTAAPGFFAWRDLVARGGDVWIRGAYGHAGRDHMGAFVIDKGPLSVGIALDDRGVAPRVFGLDTWLLEQETALNRWLEERGRPAAARERGVPGPRSSP